MLLKSIFNQLKLAYSPLCNRDFVVLKGDAAIRSNLENSCLYTICQRPELGFFNLNYHVSEGLVKCDIRQEGNPNILEIEFPLFQKRIANDPSKFILIYSGSHKPIHNINNSLDYVTGFRIHEGEDEHTLGRFLVWFTPEKLLHNIWNGGIIATVKGDIREFTKYKVLYVGKATDQKVWQRLTGHSTLQEILSVEYPITDTSLPTHEITILFFTIKESIQSQSFNNQSNALEVSKCLLNENYPTARTIFLDAEKALIHAMHPKYNKELFKKYPISTDGLFKDKYSHIIYSFSDPITLQYKEGEIRGGVKSDVIHIENNQSVSIKTFQ